MVEEFFVEDIIFILCGLKEWFEIYYGVNIYDWVIVLVVVMFDCYILDCFLFDKVIDLIDEVCVIIWIEIDLMLLELDEVIWCVM